MTSRLRKAGNKIPWGLAAAAVGAIGSAVIGGNVAQSAADTQANAATSASATEAAAADQATQAQLQMFGQTEANEQPFLAAGGNALTALQAGTGTAPGGTGSGPLNTPYPTMAPFTTAQFQNSPGYQFQLQQGEGAVLNNASAIGGVNSGNTLRALTQVGQGTANQDYWNAYNAYVNNYQQGYQQYTNNQNQTFNQLQTLAGSGQNAAGNLGALGSATAGNVGNIATGTAAQIGANTIGAGNSISAGQVAAGQTASNALNSTSNNALLLSLLNGGSTGQTSGGPSGADIGWT